MSKNQKRITKCLVPLISFVIVIAVIIVKGEFKNIVEAIRGIRPIFLLLGFFLIGAYWTFEAIILHRLLHHAKERLSFWKTLRITLAGQFFNGITPFASGGQPAQLYMLHRLNVPLGTGASVLTKKFIIYQVALVIYSFIVLIFESRFFLGQIPNFVYLGVVGFVVNFAVIGSLILIGYNYRFTKGLVIKVTKFLKRHFNYQKVNHRSLKFLRQINLFHQQMEENHSGIGTWIIIGFLSMLQLTFFFSIPLVIGYGFHMTHLSIFYMIGAAAFVSMVTAFIPLPGAAIGAEGSFYLVYQIFFPSKIVITALLLWRLFTYYLPLIVGGTVVMIGNDKSDYSIDV
ncbi:lysylphosphatidylglycerol synthase transmembrane domain-containing protein [Fusibacter bizertensis]|uniref:Phosphatidylglycerol lysyltransferase n=1 Tax=Fusibacter bizertensis TaxID=1488331 RepID=A0ABT6NBQ9_9FIRM|nr:lysylphosphatidylglycerol synthase transmembrane domain-containing protein [Fusibacter bizertensis]MDH8677853.1 lysylphosphatidylglycerol synthase transmembrane domain-containing protein [Fusibacter bizertensis]